MTYSFKNDYSEGAHPLVLQEMMNAQNVQCGGYGEDEFTHLGRKRIQAYLQQPNAAIHFVSGGTQANLIVISALLKPYESVIAASSGHIAVHETGAIEAVGHKVHTVDTEDGILRPADVEQVLDLHKDEHSVKPKLVYISNATELGTVYSKKQLKYLSDYCRSAGLLLYMDGARLGAALMSAESDLTLKEIAQFVDVFYIGATKNGAYLGEAIVIMENEMQRYFRYHLKQKGALLAKGSLLGLQFAALFNNDLYFELAAHANRMAQKLAAAFSERGFSFFAPPVSNQIFPILPLDLIEHLQEEFQFYVWKELGENQAVVRIVCSWATPEEKVDEFIKCL